ncbi:hypothetical protein HYU92_02605 [Candidatus Curtissbacteria bacterium]|nr:hypothetical protein [Candidatus Curtissbacteria bacterium]
MDNLNSVIGFFYNIIPGLLFFYINDRNLKIINIESATAGNALKILLLIAFGLFMGFIFQSLTKLLRQIFLNKIIFLWIKFSDLDLYDAAVSELKKINRKKPGDTVNNFYLMHNYLASVGRERLPEYFSARFAFWSNIFFALSISLIINDLIFNQTKIELPATDIKINYTIFIFCILYSLVISLMNFHDMYDTVLKSFITIKKIEPETQKTKTT